MVARRVLGAVTFAASCPGAPVDPCGTNVSCIYNNCCLDSTNMVPGAEIKRSGAAFKQQQSNPSFQPQLNMVIEETQHTTITRPICSRISQSATSAQQVCSGKKIVTSTAAKKSSAPLQATGSRSVIMSIKTHQSSPDCANCSGPLNDSKVAPSMWVSVPADKFSPLPTLSAVPNATSSTKCSTISDDLRSAEMPAVETAVVTSAQANSPTGLLPITALSGSTVAPSHQSLDMHQVQVCPSIKSACNNGVGGADQTYNQTTVPVHSATTIQSGSATVERVSSKLDRTTSTVACSALDVTGSHQASRKSIVGVASTRDGAANLCTPAAVPIAAVLTAAITTDLPAPTVQQSQRLSNLAPRCLQSQKVMCSKQAAPSVPRSCLLTRASQKFASHQVLTQPSSTQPVDQESRQSVLQSQLTNDQQHATSRRASSVQRALTTSEHKNTKISEFVPWNQIERDDQSLEEQHCKLPQSCTQGLKFQHPMKIETNPQPELKPKFIPSARNQTMKSRVCKVQISYPRLNGQKGMVRVIRKGCQGRTGFVFNNRMKIEIPAPRH